jgi:hypothetical protein
MILQDGMEILRKGTTLVFLMPAYLANFDRRGLLRFRTSMVRREKGEQTS